MKFVRDVIAALAALVAVSTSHVQAASCVGKFANPITDICWSCMFPIKIAGATLVSSGQEDTPNPGGNPACFCGNPPMVGMSVSFWEPARRVDVVREPFCMVSLGGVKMDPGFDAPQATRFRHDGQGQSSFYQVHWYIDPVMFYLQAILDSNCLENTGFDLAYLTELDPLWNDDELTRIINPDVYLFGNLPARAACAADCVTATAGFPNASFYWCAGCQGSLYPLNGHVQAHVGGVQASSLLTYRITAKMHREGLMWAASGENGMCGYYLQLLMDKTNYKYQMLYPIPQTEKISGKCCQPFGRSTILWGAGKEFPFEGEDFSYQIFRKRNCCQGASIAP
jgi:conjugal transfer pilus assembly protein TraU